MKNFYNGLGIGELVLSVSILAILVLLVNPSVGLKGEVGTRVYLLIPPHFIRVREASTDFGN